MEIFAVLGLSVIGCLLGLVLILFIWKRCCQNMITGDTSDELELCNGDIHVHSAPNSRSSTPRASRRSSTGSVTSSRQVTYSVRSVTPELNVPAQRIQPRYGAERNGSETALQFQHQMLAAVNPDLYMGSSAEENGDPELRQSLRVARLCFAFLYDVTLSKLTVHLIKAKNLRVRDKGAKPPDPFVRVYLLPDERSYQESRTRKKTSNPTFNELFLFEVHGEEVASRTLRISVYDVDQQRVRHSLGHVVLPLNTVDLTKSQSQQMWRVLQATPQVEGGLGEVNISLCYTPTSDRLRVVILRARGLSCTDDQDIYARVEMLYAQRIIKVKLSNKQVGTPHPVLNANFAFSVAGRQVEACAVKFTLVACCDVDDIPECDYGSVILGPFMYSRGGQLTHWQDVIGKPGEALVRWHRLSPP